MSKEEFYEFLMHFYDLNDKENELRAHIKKLQDQLRDAQDQYVHI
jgi:hypothetical protein